MILQSHISIACVRYPSIMSTAFKSHHLLVSCRVQVDLALTQLLINPFKEYQTSRPAVTGAPCSSTLGKNNMYGRIKAQSPFVSKHRFDLADQPHQQRHSAAML